jgi:hypothetical protein
MMTHVDENESGDATLAIARRFTNLIVLKGGAGRSYYRDYRRDYRCRLDWRLAQKGMDTAAKALGGKPRSVQLQALMDAHAHEEGLGAVFEILRDCILVVEKCQL